MQAPSADVIIKQNIHFGWFFIPETSGVILETYSTLMKSSNIYLNSFAREKACRNLS